MTEYANVYELLAAQTGAVLFDINDKTSLRVGRDGSGGVPVDGDPVGMMLDVSDTGGQTMAAYAASQPELVTSGTFDTDLTGWDAQAYAVVSWSNGSINVLRTNSFPDTARQAITCVVGSYYLVSVDVLSVGNSNERVHFGTQASMPTTGNVTDNNGVGSYSLLKQATATTMYLHLGVRGNNQSCSFDNISVKEISSHAAIAPSDSARPNLASYNSPISSREVLTTTYGWNITDGGRA